MRAFLQRLWRFLIQALAVVSASLFVLAALLALVLFNIERRMFNPDVYEQALEEQRVYERLPALLAQMLGVAAALDPCAEYPLACAIDGASPELQACLVQALGEEAYAEIGSTRRKPSEAELAQAQPCLDQFGPRPGNMLVVGSPALIDCYTATLGEDIYQTLSSNERRPTEQEARTILACIQSYPDALGFNPMTTASAELQACLIGALGQEAYDALASGQRRPNETEYEQMVPCLAQFGLPAAPAEASDQQGGPPEMFTNLTAEDWEQIIAAILPPEEAKALIEQALDQVFAYLNGETDTARISLVDFKAHLAGPAGVDALLPLLRAQPDCTPEEIAALTIPGERLPEDFPLCNPPEEMIPQLKAMLETQLQYLIADIPNEATLIKPSSAPNPEEGGPLQGIQFLRLLMRLSPILPIAFLLLVTMLVVRTLKGWLRWWGEPLLISGALGLLLGWLTMPVFRLAFAGFVAPRIPSGLPPQFMEFTGDVLGAILQNLISPVIWQAALLGMLGLTMLIGAAFVRREPRFGPDESKEGDNP